MTKRWEAKRAGFGRGTKDRSSSSYRFHPIALAGLLDPSCVYRRFFFLCVHALLRACCARQWSFRCCCCSGCGKLTPRVPAPLRFFLPSFLPFVRVHASACRTGKIWFRSNLLSLSWKIFPTKIFPIGFERVFWGGKLLIFFFFFSPLQNAQNVEKT